MRSRATGCETQLQARMRQLVNEPRALRRADHPGARGAAAAARRARHRRRRADAHVPPLGRSRRSRRSSTRVASPRSRCRSLEGADGLPLGVQLVGPPGGRGARCWRSPRSSRRPRRGRRAAAPARPADGRAPRPSCRVSRRAPRRRQSPSSATMVETSSSSASSQVIGALGAHRRSSSRSVRETRRGDRAEGVAALERAEHGVARSARASASAGPASS